MPLFMKIKKSNLPFPITSKDMTRFNITLEESVKMVIWALNNSQGGEIFVPKIPSYKITDLAKAIDPTREQKIIGIRPGEKIHEELISKFDSENVIDIGKYYLILSKNNFDKIKNNYSKKFRTKNSGKNFSYNSLDNQHYLNNKEISKLI